MPQPEMLCLSRKCCASGKTRRHGTTPEQGMVINVIRLNGVEYEFRGELSLAELVCDYNLTHALVELDSCIVIVNGAAIPPEQAQNWILSDNETVFIVPKLDGG